MATDHPGGRSTTKRPVPDGWNRAFTAAVNRVGRPSFMFCATSAMWDDGREPTEVEIQDWVRLIEEAHRGFPSGARPSSR